LSTGGVNSTAVKPRRCAEGILAGDEYTITGQDVDRAGRSGVPRSHEQLCATG
jgi:hypothetical protein